MATGELQRLIGTSESLAPRFTLTKESGWKVYLFVGSVILAGFLEIPSLRVGPLFNMIAMSGALAIIFTLGRHRPEQRIPWLLVALGQIVFVGGDIITYNYQRFFGGEPPFPSLGDLFYLSVYPFLVAGILLMIRRRSPGRDRASLIDSLIIGFGVATLSWVFLIAPYLHDPTLTVYQKLVAMAYPVMDLILFTVAVRLGMGAGKRSTGFYLMMASIGVLFVTDAIYGWIVLHGGYDNTTGYLEAGWGMFYLLLGAAALHLTTPMIETPEPEHEATQPRLRVLLLAGAALMAPTVNIVQSLRGEAVDVPIVAAAAALMFIFVLMRLNGLMVDISQYRRTARALTEAEARYRSLVEGLPAVVYVADFGEQGDFTYVSPQIESVLGFTPEEFQTAAFWRERIIPEDRARAVDAELRLAGGNARLEVEYRMLGKDGQQVWIREDADAVRDENGIPLYLQGVMYDITEQKTIEQKLVKALATEKETNRIRSEFVLMINHELRTPLTSVVSGAEVLAEFGLPEDDRQMIIADMLRDGRRLDGLISQMLTVARIENSGLNFSLTRTEVSRVLSGSGKPLTAGSTPWTTPGRVTRWSTPIARPWSSCSPPLPTTLSPTVRRKWRSRSPRPCASTPCSPWARSPSRRCSSWSWTTGPESTASSCPGPSRSSRSTAGARGPGSASISPGSWSRRCKEPSRSIPGPPARSWPWAYHWFR